MMDLNVRTLGGGAVSMQKESLGSLIANLSGDLLLPGDPGYDQARQVWNGMIDRRPAMIARCKDSGDVVTAVNFARQHNILVAVRGGGHSVNGSAVCDGGLVIDLSPMKDIQVDAQARTARAEPGITWGELDRATQVHGLATPGGVVSTTGIAGLTLGGGLGWLRRKHGLACDNLVSVEIVTADGQIRRASATENGDLFWGLQGGGGNFGVVTSFEYRLHPVGPELMFAFVFYPVSAAKRVLRFFHSYTAGLPDEVNSFAVLGTVPKEEFYPQETQGEDYALLMATYVGPVAEGERILQPMREVATPMLDLSGPWPYLEIQSLLDDDYPAGELQYYWKSLHLRNLSDPAIDTLIAIAAERPSPHSTLDIWHMGGALSRVGPEESAFGDRSAPYLLGVEANWEDSIQNDANVAWTREACERMAPFSTGKSYLNFEEPGEKFVKAALGRNYERLVMLKNKYDPKNLFRQNQNIRPVL
jgi:hypothetical protein